MLRDEMKLSQKEIAKTLNVSRECYSLYETGKRHIPAEVLRNLSQLHNVSIDYLLEATDNRTPNRQLNAEEEQLLEAYKQLDRRGKRITQSVLSNELSESKRLRKVRGKIEDCDF